MTEFRMLCSEAQGVLLPTFIVSPGTFSRALDEQQNHGATP
jgi:hypothetical protein